MRLDLKDISDSGLNQKLSGKIEEFPLLLNLQEHEELRFTDLIVFELRLQKSGQIVEVDGSFATQVALTCGYCLQKFEQRIDGYFTLTFTPLIKNSAVDEAEELELDADELGLVYYKDETLELLQPLQEQVLMALPIAPHCSEVCQGLCLECGCDLNKETCNCEKKAFNNKFTTLAGLKLDRSV